MTTTPAFAGPDALVSSATGMPSRCNKWCSVGVAERRAGSQSVGVVSPGMLQQFRARRNESETAHASAAAASQPQSERTEKSSSTAFTPGRRRW